MNVRFFIFVVVAVWKNTIVGFWWLFFEIMLTLKRQKTRKRRFFCVFFLTFLLKC